MPQIGFTQEHGASGGTRTHFPDVREPGHLLQIYSPQLCPVIRKTIRRDEKLGTEHKVATQMLLIKLLKINFSSQSASKKLNDSSFN